MHLNFVHAIFFIAFWLLLFMAREDLGLKGILFFIVVWGACVVMYKLGTFRQAYIVGAMGFVDAIVVVIFLGKDVRSG